MAAWLFQCSVPGPMIWVHLPVSLRVVIKARRGRPESAELIPTQGVPCHRVVDTDEEMLSIDSVSVPLLQRNVSWQLQVIQLPHLQNVVPQTVRLPQGFPDKQELPLHGQLIVNRFQEQHQ